MNSSGRIRTCNWTAGHFKPAETLRPNDGWRYKFDQFWLTVSCCVVFQWADTFISKLPRSKYVQLIKQHYIIQDVCEKLKKNKHIYLVPHTSKAAEFVGLMMYIKLRSLPELWPLEKTWCMRNLERKAIRNRS